jgi:gliding motility-associated-like protein
MRNFALIILFFIWPFISTAQLPITGLVAWYPFCGNTNDYSGNGYNMLNSGASLTTDRFGNSQCAYEFNGINNMIYYSTYFPVTTDLTYCCWIYPYRMQLPSILYNGNSNLNGLGLIMYNGASSPAAGDKAALLIGNVANFLPTTISLNQWHHLVLRKNGGIFELIIDTVSVGSFSSSFYPLTNIFCLGLDNTDGTNPFNGKIDDVVIYDRALSNAEISQLYHFNPDVNSFSLGNDTSICSGSLILTAPTGSSLYSYAWSTGSTAPSIAVSSNGNYWLTVSNAYGCKASDTIHVQTGSLYVNLGPDTALCPGDIITLSSSPTSTGVSYSWNTGATSSSITVTSAGTYWLNASNGPCNGSDSVTVTMKPLPIVDLGSDVSACTGQIVTLQSQGSFISPLYYWNNGDSTPSLSVSAAGKYWLRVSLNRCVASDTINVSYKANPIIFLGNDTAICKGDKITIFTHQPLGSAYLWNTGSTDSFITVTGTGDYLVKVTNNGCSATASINIKELIAPSLFLGNDTAICSGEMLVLSATSAMGTIQWSDGSTESNLSVLAAGIYWGTISNICGSKSDTIHVAYDLCDIWFPSAFTPNGDGLNDIIRVRGSLNEFKDFSLTIFNRWGQKVFHTTDIYSGWDGRFNGINQEPGTYFYMIFYNLHGKKGMLRGDFELIR